MRPSTITTFALSLLLSAAHAQQPPYPWHIIEQSNRTHNETTRLLTTSSANTYTSEDGSPKRATLQSSAQAPSMQHHHLRRL